MHPRVGAFTVRRSFVLIALIVLGSGCESETRSPPSTPQGPDLSAVTTTAELAAAIRAYDGPYTIRITNHRDGTSTVVHFDGLNLSMVFGEGYENRATSDGWCYQGGGSDWVGERTVDDADLTLEHFAGMSLSGRDQWTEATRIEDLYDLSTVAGGLELRTVNAPSPERVDRVALRVEGNRLVRLDAFIGEERYGTDRYFWGASPRVRPPANAQDGFDLQC